MAHRWLYVLGVAVLLSGCMGMRGQTAVKWPWADRDGTVRSVCAKPSCDASEALRAYMEASQFCRNVAIYYENGGKTSGLSQFAVGTIGVLAGSVAAPIAQGTAATAWSGLSGATNALQIPMEQTFSASLATTRQNAVVVAAANGAAAYREAGTDSNKQALAALNMALECSLAPSRADQEALRSLSDVNKSQRATISGK